MTTRIKKPASSAMIPRLAVLLALPVMLLSAAGCQPAAKPTTEVDRDPETERGSSTSAAATAPDLPPAEVPLSQFLRFGHLGTEQGLSNSTAWDLMKDSRGYLWIATFDGLNRYDGYDMTVFQHDPDDPHSIGSNFIDRVIEDNSGIIWVGTASGFDKFDPSTEQFTRYTFDPDVRDSTVSAIIDDSQGRLWIGSSHGILYQFDRGTETLNPVSSDKEFGKILDIVQDQEGILWIGHLGGLTRFDPDAQAFTQYLPVPDTVNRVKQIEIVEEGILWLAIDGQGLARFDPKTEQFAVFRHDPQDPQSLSSDAVMTVLEDEPGVFWVGTYGWGLNRFDSKTGKSVRYQTNPYHFESLSDDRIPALLKDEQDTLWVGTYGNGVNIYNPLNSQFIRYQHIPDEPQSLSHNEVRSVRQDKNGAIWFGSLDGLDRLDPRTGLFSHYQHDPENPYSLSDNHILALHIDSEGIIWIGTWPGGLNRFDPATERFTHYVHDPDNPASLSNNQIQDIAEDDFGNLWVATNWGGLNRFNSTTEQFTRYYHDPDDPNSLSGNNVLSVDVTPSNIIWVGTNNGLNRFDPETEQFVRYPEHFKGQAVYMVHESRAKVLWVATRVGLTRFDPETGSISTYTTKHGLASEIIMGILEDAQGNLWFSTVKGISRFNPTTETVENFDSHSGVQKRDFLFGSAYQASDGQMFFGGKSGLNAFYPEMLRGNDFVPPVVLTDFKLANQSVELGENSHLQEVIGATDELALPYEDKVFSIEFAALNYVSPEKNQFAYKMEGFDDDWTVTDSANREARYTNLDAGEYTFRVKASNNDGVWNEEGASLRITITPPWWETTWFRIGLVVVAIGLVLSIYRWRVRTIEARSRELEAQVEQRTQELRIAKDDADEARAAAEAANRAKSTFLANMSHELRTPLSAILGFTRLLDRDPGISRQQGEMLDIIDRSGEHLLGMVDDVLSLSRIEAGRIELREEPFDVVQTLKDIGLMFKPRAEGKGLQFDLELDAGLPPYLQGDAGKLRQVLINLLGNAVRYTEEGHVWLRARSQPVADDSAGLMLQLEVEDTGRGIPSDQLDRVFEPFVQGEQRGDDKKGTGLGLTISRLLVGMMGGEIAAESELGQGSLFRVTIPMQLAEAGAVAAGEGAMPEVVGLQAGQRAWRILVVDDNLENRQMLTNLLTQVGFTVQEAENGEEAIAVFEDWRPHLIWMDVRMPVMDGYEATRRIRALPGGDAVKIAAVTASVFEEQREEILASGCDDLVRKPFREHQIFETMARLLDVEYIYEQAGEAPARAEEIDLTAGMLADLPSDLRQALDEATLALDREATLEVIERIEEQAPDTATALRALVEDLRLGRIRALLEETEK